MSDTENNDEIEVVEIVTGAEDADGNVYSRKVYEDLKRQGLV